ncbi:MAG: hypothetical protein AAF616_02530 [Bacteroidota bacterium]
MTIFGFSIEVYFINLGIAIPTFFILRWLTSKLTRKPIRKFIPWIGTVVLTPIIYISMLFVWIWSIAYYPDMAFNEVEWRNNPSERYELTDDLIESELLIGLTKNEVKELLGDYDYTYDENHWAYGIGHVPALFNIDPSVLDVYFENERVIKVSQQET